MSLGGWGWAFRVYRLNSREAARRSLPFDILKRAKRCRSKNENKKWEHRSNLGKKEKNNRKVNIGGSNPELATANTKPSDLVIDGRFTVKLMAGSSF